MMLMVGPCSNTFLTTAMPTLDWSQMHHLQLPQQQRACHLMASMQTTAVGYRLTPSQATDHLRLLLDGIIERTKSSMLLHVHADFVFE
jgi:hypothetical protein